MIYPSVTTVLSPFSDFSQVPPDRLAYAAERGSRVHACCAAYAQRLWVPDLPEDHVPYFESFRQWFDTYVKEVLWVERELFETTFYYKGHPDAGVILISGERVLVDYKTPAQETRTWRAQISAYCRMAGVDKGMVLKLSSTGHPAKAIVYQQTSADFSAFLAALTAYRYFKM